MRALRFIAGTIIFCALISVVCVSAPLAFLTSPLGLFSFFAWAMGGCIIIMPCLLVLTYALRALGVVRSLCFWEIASVCVSIMYVSRLFQFNSVLTLHVWPVVMIGSVGLGIILLVYGKVRKRREP